VYVSSIPILLLFCWSKPHGPSSSTLKNGHPKVGALKVKTPALELFAVPLYNSTFAGISKNKNKGPDRGVTGEEADNFVILPCFA
jgi:hypothetical protein